MNNNCPAKAPKRNSQVARVRALIVIALVAVCSPSGLAQSTNAPARLSYDSFRMISDRNIFNPSRFARSSGRTSVRTSATPASRVESFALVGIMAYEKGTFAFFDGTKGDYKQALQVDGAIGEYKVTRVTPDLVQLAIGTNTFDLKVGMQMRREDEGDWFLSEGSESPRRRVISTRTRTRGGSATDESSITGETGDNMTGAEPEVIVLESDALTEPAEGETPAPNGNGNNNGEAPRGEAEPDTGGVSDPVLLRLMQRRQQMTQ